MTKSTPDVDVAIIGGGPAGSATAAYLSRAGMSCRVLEKERFPRFHVGESLVPATTRIFDDLGFLPKMEEAGFVHKYGAAWTSDDAKPTYDVDWEGLDDARAEVQFAERPQDGVDQPYTYHVDRARFDHLLLQHAEQLGADVWQETAVREVDFSEEPLVRVGYQREGSSGELWARMVVDASGRRTFLGNRLDLKVTDPVFDQYALHTWFEGYDRGGFAGREDYIFIHFLPVENIWVWQIPISDSVTSIGVVAQRDTFRRHASSQEDFFWGCLGTRPELKTRLEEARRVRPIQAEGDYSYAMRRLSGDRFVLVGDAARFVDPIFSSGVSIALQSARLAARDILAAEEAGSFDRGKFARFENTMQRGCRNWYEFISLYYRLNVLFTYFVTDPEYRLDVLRLLQGDVYDEEEPEVLRRMREVVERVENDPSHVWHDLLGDLKAPALDPTELG